MRARTAVFAAATLCACAQTKEEEKPLTWDTAKSVAVADVKDLQKAPADAASDDECVDTALATAKDDAQAGRLYFRACADRPTSDLAPFLRAAGALGGVEQPDVLAAVLVVMGRRGDVVADAAKCRRAGLPLQVVDGAPKRPGSVVVAMVRVLRRPETGKKTTLAEVTRGGGRGARGKLGAPTFVYPTGRTLDVVFPTWRLPAPGDYVLALRVQSERSARDKDWEHVNEANGDNPFDAEGDLVAPPVPIGPVLSYAVAVQNPGY